jgi:hypothetical protein
MATINTTSTLSVNNLADSAFVPNMQQKEPMTASEREAALRARLAGKRISTPVFANPDNGEHSVVIHSRELREGRNGNEDYFVFRLKDIDRNICWDMSLTATEEILTAFESNINMYSNGVVQLMEIFDGLDALERKTFKVWTQQYKDDKGNARIKTYVNPDKYQKFANYIAFKLADEKKAAAKLKAEKKAVKSKKADQ